MRIRKFLEKILDIITDKDLLFICIVLFISIYSLATAFYSYGKVNLSELIQFESTIIDIETDFSGRVDYVTFRTSDNDRFYVSVNGLKKGGAQDFANNLENVVTPNEKVTVFCTNRRILFPGFYSFSSYHRVVAIQTEDEAIISVDDFNNANKNYFIGCIVGSVVFMLFAIGLIKLKT